MTSIDSAFGPASLTQDGSSNLEWLDLTETQGLSYNQVLPLLEPAGKFEGFRYATIAELDGLMANAGIPNRGLAWNYGTDAENARALINFLSEKNTIAQIPQSLGLLGQKAYDWQSDDARALGFVLWLGSPTPGLDPGQYPAAQASPGLDATSMWRWEARATVGSFLVRVVPEPSSLTLLGIGLLATTLITCAARPRA